MYGAYVGTEVRRVIGGCYCCGLPLRRRMRGKIDTVNYVLHVSERVIDMMQRGNAAAEGITRGKATGEK